MKLVGGLLQLKFGVVHLYFRCFTADNWIKAPAFNQSVEWAGWSCPVNFEKNKGGLIICLHNASLLNAGYFTAKLAREEKIRKACLLAWGLGSGLAVRYCIENDSERASIGSNPDAAVDADADENLRSIGHHWLLPLPAGGVEFRSVTLLKNNAINAIHNLHPNGKTIRNKKKGSMYCTNYSGAASQATLQGRRQQNTLKMGWWCFWYTATGIMAIRQHKYERRDSKWQERGY